MFFAEVQTRDRLDESQKDIQWIKQRLEVAEKENVTLRQQLQGVVRLCLARMDSQRADKSQRTVNSEKSFGS